MGSKLMPELPKPVHFVVPDWVHKKRMLTLLSLEEIRWEFLRAKQRKLAARATLAMMQVQFRPKKHH